jgi:hypothetical protein
MNDSSQRYGPAWVAKTLGISRRAARRLMASGRITSFDINVTTGTKKVRHYWVTRPEYVEAFMRHQGAQMPDSPSTPLRDRAGAQGLPSSTPTNTERRTIQQSASSTTECRTECRTIPKRYGDKAPNRRTGPANAAPSGMP